MCHNTVTVTLLENGSSETRRVVLAVRLSKYALVMDMYGCVIHNMNYTMEIMRPTYCRFDVLFQSLEKLQFI